MHRYYQIRNDMVHIYGATYNYIHDVSSWDT